MTPELENTTDYLYGPMKAQLTRGCVTISDLTRGAYAYSTL